MGRPVLVRHTIALLPAGGAAKRVAALDQGEKPVGCGGGARRSERRLPRRILPATPDAAPSAKPVAVRRGWWTGGGAKAVLAGCT